MREPGKFLALMNHCNSEVANQNDYLIATNIIRRIVKNEDLSIEEVAGEINISTASVSRFIRKVGFKNWQDFRENCTGVASEMLSRRLFPSEKLTLDEQALAFALYEKAVMNIKQTRDLIDTEKLIRFISIMKQADSVTFLGDEHALSCFYTFQLDLIFGGIPAYLYKNTQIQNLEAGRCTADSVVVFLNVENNFVTEDWKNAIRKMRERKAKVIVFSQQDLNGIMESDETYIYGISGSVNDGYYSLFLLSQILSELMIKFSFSKNENDLHE